MDIKKKREILRAIRSGEYFNITKLANELEWPRTTLVYYINLLVKESLVEKQRGNIRIIDSGAIEHKTNEKYNINKRAKEAIALKAASYINDGDIIFLDGGSTTAYMINHLRKKDIIIYTNNTTLVENIPVDGFLPKVYVVPGEVYKKTSTITGSLATSFISRIYIDKAFVGVNTVCNGRYFTTNQEEAVTKKTLLNNSKQAFILYDKSKISKNISRYMFADISKANNIKEVVK